MKVINSQISSRECNCINNRSNGIFDYALLTKTKGGQQILKRNNIPLNNCPRGDNVDLDTVSGWTIFLGGGGGTGYPAMPMVGGLACFSLEATLHLIQSLFVFFFSNSSYL